MPFPTNPTNNQTYNDGTYTYRYSSTFRTWTKIAQTTSNVSNVVTSSGNITTGNTTITSTNVVVGTTTVSSSNVSVGNTLISNSNVTVGNTIISNNDLQGNLSNGTTSISMPSANGNIAFSAGGNSNVFVLSGTGTTITGTANITANLTAGNIESNNANFTGTGSFNGNVNLNSYNIINLAAPVNSTDAATKQYVDNIAEGLHVHAPCLAATPDTLANISSGTITYDNGTSGVGATLTTTGTYATIDGVNIATVGTRILVKNEANTAHNGIYTYTSGTVLTRATDFNTPTEMAGGDFTFIQFGTLYNDTGWVMTDAVTTVGTSPVVFVQFSGAGTYTAGTGLTLTGTQFSVNADQSFSNLTVTGNTSLGNVGNVSITGGTANYVLQTDGTGNLSWVAQAGGGGSPGGSNTQIQYNDNGSFAGSAAFIFDNTTNNITATGNISSNNLSVTANITAGNIIGIFANGTSDIRIPTANGNISIDVGDVTDEVVIANTGVAIAGNLSVTGNISGNNLTSTRVITRVTTNGATTSGTITANAVTTDQFNVIGLNGSTTIANPSGTALDGQKLTIRIKDAGSAQTLAWGDQFRVIGVTLPTTTVAGKYTYVGCVYNSTDIKWDVVAVTTEA